MSFAFDKFLSIEDISRRERIHYSIFDHFINLKWSVGRLDSSLYNVQKWSRLLIKYELSIFWKFITVNFCTWKIAFFLCERSRYQKFCEKKIFLKLFSEFPSLESKCWDELYQLHDVDQAAKYFQAFMNAVVQKFCVSGEKFIRNKIFSMVHQKHNIYNKSKEKDT